MRPPAVAITGGIGAGKSELLKAFARHGAATISSDEIVHRLLREDEEVKQAIVEKLGRIVLRKGEIDRSRVANLVFRDRELLAWLEAPAPSARLGRVPALARRAGRDARR